MTEQYAYGEDQLSYSNYHVYLCKAIKNYMFRVSSVPTTQLSGKDLAATSSSDIVEEKNKKNTVASDESRE